MALKVQDPSKERKLSGATYTRVLRYAIPLTLVLSALAVTGNLSLETPVLLINSSLGYIIPFLRDASFSIIAEDFIRKLKGEGEPRLEI